MGEPSGVEAEITENESMSDGVDGALMSEDGEVVMDTSIKGMGQAAGIVVASPLDRA